MKLELGTSLSTPPETSENQTFSYVFREYKKTPVS